jgi:hypothetical protein
MLEKHEVGFQPFFDYLVVSGIVFLKSDIIELVRKRVPEFRDRFKKAAVARFKKEKIVPDMKEVIFQMYDRDFDSLSRFCIEENIKKFWLFEILITEFVKENPVIINHIVSCKALKISERKKSMDRLKKVDYVRILNAEDAELILNRNTEKYDTKSYSGHLQVELHDIMLRAGKLVQQTQKKEEEGSSLDALVKRISRSRNEAILKLEEPVDIDEEPESDYEDDE